MVIYYITCFDISATNIILLSQFVGEIYYFIYIIHIRWVWNGINDFQSEFTKLQNEYLLLYFTFYNYIRFLIKTLHWIILWLAVIKNKSSNCLNLYHRVVYIIVINTNQVIVISISARVSSTIIQLGCLSFIKG